jgi:hypothetical protein
MNGNVEELLRDGMERFTADVRAPAELASEAGRLHRRHRRRVRTAVAGGTAAVAAVTAAAVALAFGPGAAARQAGSPAQARTVAYVTKRVENALASENLVYVGRSDSKITGDYVTWAYGPRSRWEAYSNGGEAITPSGVRPWKGPYWVQGTALVGGKLVGAYVTYFDHRYSLWPLKPQPGSVCSKNAAFGMAAPIIPTTHWSSYIGATLACGAATVTGHVKIDGVETTEITGKPDTVKLSAGYSKVVNEKFATARWTLYVDPVTYLPVRMVGSTETFGGSAGSTTSTFVTNVQWLQPTRANVAQTLVTIPPGFHRFYGLPGNQ